MKIGSIKFNGLCLAPMEDVTDIAFRLTCKKYGAGMVYTEMCHSPSLVRGIMDRSETCEEERPVGIQVAGKDWKEVVEAAKAVEGKADLIDINLGCPGRNVIGRGYGSALLKTPDVIGEIISHLSEAVKVPVTAKMRAGYTNDANALKIAKVIEDAGGQAIAIHPRTKEQGYSGRADWTIIKDVKKEISIPVIGNGDIRSGRDAHEIYSLTKCDGIMVGRAAIGDPLIFKRILDYLKDDGKEAEVASTIEERIKAFEVYVKFAKHYGLVKKVRFLRQAQQVTRMIPGAATFRQILPSTKDPEEIVRKTIEFLSTQRILS